MNAKSRHPDFTRALSLSVPKLHFTEVAHLADHYPDAGPRQSAALRLISRIRELEMVGSRAWHFSGHYLPLTNDEVAEIVKIARASENSPWANSPRIHGDAPARRDSD